jgi:hypothetical protein
MSLQAGDAKVKRRKSEIDTSLGPSIIPQAVEICSERLPPLDWSVPLVSYKVWISKRM